MLARRRSTGELDQSRPGYRRGVSGVRETQCLMDDEGKVCFSTEAINTLCHRSPLINHRDTDARE